MTASRRHVRLPLSGPVPRAAASSAIVLALTCAAGCGGAERKGAGGAATAPAMQGTWHEARRGDTPERLARRYSVPVQDIVEINGLEHREAIAAGRKVFIPGARTGGPAGKGGAEGPAAGGKPAPVEPGRPPTAGPTPSRARMSWPLPGGKMGTGFGRRKDRVHEGIDIFAPEGTAVLAAGTGTVIYAGDGVKGYGNMILVRHAGGLVTVYAHNRRNLVQEGAEVRDGQVIAEVGHSGKATGDHLHFEVREKDTPLDPLLHLKDPGGK